MIKDRLAELKAAQQGGADVIMKKRVGSIDKFFSEVENIRESIEKMKINIKEVKTINEQILYSPQTDKKVKKHLEDITEDIKRVAKNVRQRLKVMEENIKQLEQTSLINTELRIRKTQHSMLSQVFIEVMTYYYKTQTDYMERCKDLIKKELEITNRSISDDNLEDILNTGNSYIFTQGIIRDSEEVKQNLTRIKERHSEIIQLENSIRELHDMFIDITFIIEIQGETIKSIGNHVEKASEHTINAKQMTKQARRLKQKSRRKKLLITGFILIGVVVGGVIGI